MKAAVVTAVSQLELLDIPVPELNEGEALVKVKYTGICGTDIHVMHGKHPTAKFPVVTGHEFVGEVVQVKGKGAEKFKTGDQVVVQPYFSCGTCEPCAKGMDNVCAELAFMGAHVNGSFAEYTKVLTRKMYKIPEGLSLELAALTEPIAVAVHDVRNSGLKVGESALIIGGGPIGMLIAMVARHAGASKVIISEISEYRRKFAESLGFTTVNPLVPEFDDTLRKITANKGFNVVYEVSGAKPSIKTAVDHAAIAGTVMVVGMTSEPYPIELSKIFAKELNVKGVRIHSQYSFIGAIELLRSGELNNEFKTMISKIFKLDDINAAFAYAQSGGDFFKILIEN